MSTVTIFTYAIWKYTDKPNDTNSKVLLTGDICATFSLNPVSLASSEAGAPGAKRLIGSPKRHGLQTNLWAHQFL